MSRGGRKQLSLDLILRAVLTVFSVSPILRITQTCENAGHRSDAIKWHGKRTTTPKSEGTSSLPCKIISHRNVFLRWWDFLFSFLPWHFTRCYPLAFPYLLVLYTNSETRNRNSTNKRTFMYTMNSIVWMVCFLELPFRGTPTNFKFLNSVFSSSSLWSSYL